MSIRFRREGDRTGEGATMETMLNDAVLAVMNSACHCLTVMCAGAALVLAVIAGAAGLARRAR
jgi:hypothetical protein